jgi:hypothetical protein
MLKSLMNPVSTRIEHVTGALVSKQWQFEGFIVYTPPLRQIPAWMDAEAERVADEIHKPVTELLKVEVFPS